MTKREFAFISGSLPLDQGALVMGVINTTPDSFSDGGVHLQTEKAVESAINMLDSGAHIIDVGGESTRPGSEPVDPSAEMERALPVIEGICKSRPKALISIDTRRARVAQKAINAGAKIINDVSGFRDDPDMIGLARETGAGVIIMHMLGKPKTMQKNIEYRDFPNDILEFFRERIRTLESGGIGENRIVVDPGIGFGKTFDQNLRLINRLGFLAPLGKPILVGASRKAFLGEIIGEPDPAKRDLATAAVSVAALMRGADIIRVHDVQMAMIPIMIGNAVLRERIKP
jgi:dihydropteroate synthase